MMPTPDDSVQEVVVSDEQAGLRADKALALHFKDLSRAFLQKIFDEGKVFLGNKPIDKSARMVAGARLNIVLPAPKDPFLKPCARPLEILWEDAHIVAVNKPYNSVVHPGNGTKDPTLVQVVMAHCPLSQLGGEKRPGVVHRLDKDTSGVILFAKTDAAYLGLIKCFSSRQITKEYCAIVHGMPSLRSGTIKLPIGRDPKNRTRMAVVPGGRFAHTEWWVVHGSPAHSVLGCRIHTGRTHQIRVHLSHLGYPILGDYTYGCPKNILLPPKRPLLHAHKLSFTHPVTGTTISLLAPLPEDFMPYMQK